MNADRSHTGRVAPDPDAIARARHRDELADEIERCRTRWHAARTATDSAARELREAMRAQVLAEIDYRAAVAAYEGAAR